jgi:uncharacterized membrane protein
MEEILKVLRSIEDRIGNIEKKIGEVPMPSSTPILVGTVQPVVEPTKAPLPVSDQLSRGVPERQLPKRETPNAQPHYANTMMNHKYVPSHQRQKSFDPMNGMLLALAGIGCVIVASILLVKFSIDSGWLNPSRQVVLASLLGLGLIVTPHVRNFSDKTLIGFLPATGVIVLHLTVYGAVFLHHLASPLLGIVCISIIGFISIILMNEYKDITYAAISVVGTYVGAMFFHEAFDSLWVMALFILMWDGIFCYLAIAMEKRVLILISSYLAIFLGIQYYLHSAVPTVQIAWPLFIVQFLQGLAFCGATAAYSRKHNVNLKAEESWAFFPLLVLFYGQQSLLLKSIDNTLCIWFGILFSTILFSLYHLVRRSMKKAQLESGVMIHTLCALIITHSVYLELLPEFQTIVSLLALIGLMIFGEELNKQKEYKGVLAIIVLCVTFNAGMVLLGSFTVDQDILFGSLYTLLGLCVYFYAQHSGKTSLTTQHKNMILLFANAQALVVLYRLKVYMGAGSVAPLWIAYAFGLMAYAWKWKNFSLAQWSLPIIIISIGRFVVLDFAHLGTLERIVSLFVMGGLIFAGAYIYRQCGVSEKSNS